MSEKENIKPDEDVEAHASKSTQVKLANEEGSKSDDEADVEAHASKSTQVKLANEDDDVELHRNIAKL